jgi:8-oxo-dGTP pyrophosphatase MutT (NUDIX family)
MSENPAADPRHRNDIYAEDISQRGGGQPAIPAATVVLLRDTAQAGVEVLMLQKTSSVAFGGMWVFPGGRIDPEDYPPDGDVDAAARQAAVRETMEEAGLEAAADEFVFFAHWTPPPGTPKRFVTWFFAARAAQDPTVRIDGGEIQNHAWLRPAVALARHAGGEIDLAPPTWVTLHQLSRYGDVRTLLARLHAGGPRYFETRLGKRADGVRVALWHGDAGYEHWDADAAGDRHRLVMTPGGFLFENTAAVY